MIWYQGERTAQGARVYICGDLPRLERLLALLPLRTDLRNHSPTGFEWGYHGSGPAQLALALLAHCLKDDQRALRCYQQFKDAVIAHLPSLSWEMSEQQIRGAVATIERGRPA